MEKLTIYYDGKCSLCSAVAEHDAHATVDVQSGHLPPGATLEESLRDVHVVDSSGHVYKGAEGVLKVLEGKRGLGWLARIGHLPGFRQLAGGLYRFIAANRYYLGTRDNAGK